MQRVYQGHLPTSADVLQRYQNLPPELRQEVQRFHNQSNRQVFLEILRLMFERDQTVTGFFQEDYERLSRSPNIQQLEFSPARELIRELTDYRDLARHYNLRTNISFTFEPTVSTYESTDKFFEWTQTVNPANDLVPDDAIRDLLRIYVAYHIGDLHREEGSMLQEHHISKILKINGTLERNRIKFRLVPLSISENIDEVRVEKIC